MTQLRRLHTLVTPLRPQEIRQAADLPVTTPERTLIDCAVAGTSPEQIELAVHQALTRALTVRVVVAAR